MRKAVALLVLVAFVVLALAVPAFAAVMKPAVSTSPPATQVTLTGKVVYSNIERPHHELVVPGPMYAPPLPGSEAKPPVQRNRVYVLTGPFDFKAYEGKQVRVTGYVSTEPNIYQRGPMLRVAKIELLSNTAPVSDPQPTSVAVSVRELVQAITKALDLSVTYNNGAFIITNLANGKTVVLKF